MTSYITTLGIPCSQYVNDHQHKKLNLPEWSNFVLAEAAAVIAVSVLTPLGYSNALSTCLLSVLGATKTDVYWSLSSRKRRSPSYRP